MQFHHKATWHSSHSLETANHGEQEEHKAGGEIKGMLLLTKLNTVELRYDPFLPADQRSSSSLASPVILEGVSKSSSEGAWTSDCQ